MTDEEWKPFAAAVGIEDEGEPESPGSRHLGDLAGRLAHQAHLGALRQVQDRMQYLREWRAEAHRELAVLRIQEDFLARMVKLGETMAERIEGEADDPGTEEEG